MGNLNSAFKPYKHLLAPLPIRITLEMCDRVASRMTGGADPSGIDLVELVNWLLRFRGKSKLPKEEL